MANGSGSGNGNHSGMPTITFNDLVPSDESDTGWVDIDYSTALPDETKVRPRTLRQPFIPATQRPSDPPPSYPPHILQTACGQDAVLFTVTEPKASILWISLRALP